MGDFSDYTLCQIHDCLVVERVKESHIKKWSIGFFSVFRLHAFRECIDDFFVLFELKLLFDEIRFFDEVVDLGLKFFWDFVLIAHSMKILEFFLFLLILGFDLTDDRSDAADVIRESNATDGFDENESDSLRKIWGRDVTKSNS